MKLLTEQNDNVIVEAIQTPTGKDYYIQGIFMQADMANRNGRIYPMNILTNEVARYNQAYVSQKRALGELNHPESPSIGLDKVSHLITDLYAEGKNFIGKAKVLDTPMGKIAKTFIDEGVKLGVSSRGMGTLKEVQNGVQEVQNDFFLSAVDIVADPSASHAFVQGIMEGKDWVWNNGVLVEKECTRIQKQLKTKKLDEKTVLEAFARYISVLSKSSIV